MLSLIIHGLCVQKRGQIFEDISLVSSVAFCVAARCVALRIFCT